MSSVAVKERPILFSSPMVRAILEGRKTQTRRIVKAPVRFIGAGGRNGGEWDDPVAWGWEDPENPSHFLTLKREPDRDWCSEPILCPYGVPGDHLWARETFYVMPEIWSARRDEQPIHYAADIGHRDEVEDYVGKPSIHMPRWASRITLEITEVRVERLQEISEDDARAEGAIEAIMGLDGPAYDRAEKRWCRATKADDPDAGQATARGAFFVLWDSINGKSHPWGSNPWVWAISFKRVDA